MSVVKYINQNKAPDVQGSLNWARASFDGLPLKIPNNHNLRLRESEIQDNARASEDYHVEIFNLFKLRDRKRYTAILDQIVNNVCKLYRRELLDPPGATTYRVLLEWSSVYMELPYNLIKDHQ